ncbi:MAG: 2-oxoacid:acceptor oxidoreductase family protein [Bacillota bacterium]|nr:2-oxoacid:acceptor oxidoreductase family protein [Bacillota bacterium]
MTAARKGSGTRAVAETKEGAGVSTAVSQDMRIALAGEGGQGVQLVGEVLALAGFIAGLHSLYIPNFGVEQRGGVSLAYVQIARHPIGSPKFRHADVLVALSDRSIERTRSLVGPETLLMYDSSSIQPPVIEDDAIGIQAWDTITPEAFAHMTGTDHGARQTLERAAPFVVGLPAADIARREFVPRVFNVIVMGAVVEAIGMLSMDTVKEALDLKLGHKFKDDERLRNLNHRALARGAEIIRCKRDEEKARPAERGRRAATGTIGGACADAGADVGIDTGIDTGVDAGAGVCAGSGAGVGAGGARADAAGMKAQAAEPVRPDAPVEPVGKPDAGM